MHCAQNQEEEFYQKVLGVLSQSSIGFLVGGGFAYQQYTRIMKETKDCDIFVRQDDCQRVLDLFSVAPYTSRLIFPHWLAKITHDGHTIDVIFNSGNGIGAVDNDWFLHAVDAEVLGMPVRLVPPEEILHSKAFIMERERYDGADVAHLIRALGPRMSWTRLMRRMGPHWKVLLSHIILFKFIYPSEGGKVPFWVTRELMRRFSLEALDSQAAKPVCYGTLLSRQQYLNDITEQGYTDGRLVDPPAMSQEDIDKWTEAARDLS